MHPWRRSADVYEALNVARSISFGRGGKLCFPLKEGLKMRSIGTPVWHTVSAQVPTDKQKTKEGAQPPPGLCTPTPSTVVHTCWGTLAGLIHLNVDEINFLASHSTAFKKMRDSVTTAVGTGATLLYMHLVLQGWTNGRMAVRNDTSKFAVHQDQDGLLTVLVLLSNTATAMQIVGKPAYVYQGRFHLVVAFSRCFSPAHPHPPLLRSTTGQGDAIAFLSKLYHNTCNAEDNTMKLAFFFDLP